MNTIKKTSIAVFLAGIFCAVNAFGAVGSSNIIDTCKVRIGVNGKGDRIRFAGYVNATEADFYAALGDTLTVTIRDEAFPGNGEHTFMFPIEEDNLQKGTFKSKIRAGGKSDPVAAFKVNTAKRTFKFFARNVDLADVRCPITATIQIGGFAAVAGDYTVVDTNQADCYDDRVSIACSLPDDDFYGQDAQHNGNQPFFKDNKDGTVLDTVTGLMWQKSPDNDGNGIINADDKMTYDEAVAGARAQTTGGYTDWRLPTIKELYSLIDFSGVDPSGYEGSDTSGLIPFINTDYFDFAYGDVDAGERIIDSQWATSTKYVSKTMDGNETMFGVNFADGRIKGYPVTKTFFVIYVRGNTAYGINDFEDNGDGTVSDQATDLMWTQEDSASGMDWQEALEWVQTKNSEQYLGYKDWRLPNVKELHSIVDYSRSPATTGSAAIDPLFHSTSIINEAGQADYPCYWSSTTHAKWTEMSGVAGAYVAFGRGMGYMHGTWMDVHGAGAQRSDPKTGDPEVYPYGRGPQGDAIRIYNYVRCVRDIDN